MHAVTARRHGGLPFMLIFFEFLPVILAVLLLVCVGVGHVASRITVMQMGYQLSQLDRQGAQLILENDQLRLELATLKRPARLEHIAKTRLGLVPPSAGAVVRLTQ